MVDKRFFRNLGPFSISEISALVMGKFDLDFCDFVITDISSAEDATKSELTFLHNRKYFDAIKKSKAAACLIKEEYIKYLPEKMISIIVNEPYCAFASLLKKFYVPLSQEKICDMTFISENAHVSETTKLGNGVYVSDFVHIDNHAEICDGVFISPNTTIGKGVIIGKNSHIESNVSISFSIIGEDTFIKTGARIGQQGFGFFIGKTGPVDVLQVGRVIIGNNTIIGSNVTIDRGNMNDTVIGNNVRIDNMVHIAHNVEIGDYCVIAAQTGIAGSTKIGNGCVFGGQCGIDGHLHIGPKTIAAAQSGIMRNTTDGKKIAGSPAVSSMRWHMQNVILKKLVNNRKLINELK